MNEAIALYSLVKELKRRHMFASLVITNARVEISFWACRDTNTGMPHLIVGDPERAWAYLRAVRENERRELDWVGRRHGPSPV